MSNPFDQFGLPPAPPADAGMPGYPPPAAPPAGPPMNAPPPMQNYGAPPPQQYGGAPPPPAYGQPMSQPPPQPPAPAMQNGQNPYGGYSPAPPAPKAPEPPAMAAPPAYGMMPPAPAPPPQEPPAPYGMPPAAAAPPNPFGAPEPAAAPPPAAPEAGMAALTVSEAPSNPYAGYGAPPPAAPAPPAEANPFAAYGAPPPAAPPAYGAPPPAAPPAQAADPWGAPAPPPQEASQALVPAAQAADPFAVFQAAPAPPPPAATPSSSVTPYQQGPPDAYSQPPPAAPAPASDDFFADMGFGPAVPDTALENVQATQPGGGGAGADSGDLPPGGEWYDAKIFTPTLGVMFFKPQELTDSLFLQTEKETVDALGERPVVAFIVEGSSARSAGVELGHVLLKVNGIDVKNPKEASRLIKEGPRPLPLLFYVPNTTVVVAEGEHMVKYDTRETTAPNSAKDWKPKYVVIGGIIAQPWMMNMYRSKSEYDIAVIETQARRPVSVKVKQFSLQGARVQNDWQGPQMVKYKNKLHPWKYIVVLPVARNPIKISSPNLAQLKPVHEGIRRVLVAQQRDRGGHSPHSAAPVRPSGGQDPYANGHGGGGGDPYARIGHGGSAPPGQRGGGDPYAGGGDPYGGGGGGYAQPPPQQQQFSQPPPQQYAQAQQYRY